MKKKQNYGYVYIAVYLSAQDISIIAGKMHANAININDLYAAYVPEVSDKQGKLVGEAIF